MTIKKPNIISANIIGGDTSKYSYEQEDAIYGSTVGVSDYVLTVPTAALNIIAGLEVDAGVVARVEYTTNILDKVLKGTATWHPWANGDVSSYKDGFVVLCTAVRLVKVSGVGTARMSVRMQ